MTWRVPPFDRAVDEAAAFIRATWRVHGIIVAGSIVRGEPGPLSDLDLYCVHAQPWRMRDQRRFNGVPAEIFVSPPERIRGYFKNEHAEGRPCTAHMLTTGEVLDGADEIVMTLIAEAREWMAKPIALTAAELTSKRYGAVDTLDDARDAALTDPAMAALLFAEAVRDIAAYAFWSRHLFQPRRKDLVRALAAIDPVAAELVRAFADARGADRERIALDLAKHVLGVDTFFAWSSDRS